MDKKTNNGQQNTTQKTKVRATQTNTQKKNVGELICCGGIAIL